MGSTGVDVKNLISMFEKKKDSITSNGNKSSRVDKLNNVFI